jgi:microcystin-dependent protein
MPDAKLYLVPDPTGEADLSERAGIQTFDGADKAGELVALDSSGLLNGSLMPYAQSPDLSDAEDPDSVRIPVQVEGQLGQVWRWYSVLSLMNWVRDQIMDLVVPVGTIRLAMGSAATGRWLYMDGRTLGSDASGAVLAGDEYKRLYAHLWGALDDDNISLATSTGIPVNKGESADADWAAGRRISLPDPSSRFVMVGGAGAGLSPRAFGSVGGEEEASLSELQMPRHSHRVNSAQAGAAQRVEFMTGVQVAVSVVNDARTALVGSPTAAVGYAKVESHDHSSVVTIGSGSAPHTHGVATPAADLTHTHAADNDVTVEPAQLQVAAGQLTTDSANASHGHTGAAVISGTSSSGNGHTHTLQFLGGYTASTTVTSTPKVTVTPSKNSVSVFAVSSGNATTTDAGGGVAHNNMPPFFSVAALIRY